MTFLALIAIIFFSFAVYNLTCAFVDIPTKKTSQMMMLSRKQQGTKNEKLLDVYVTKIAGWIAPYLRLDRLKPEFSVHQSGLLHSSIFFGFLCFNTSIRYARVRPESMMSSTMMTFLPSSGSSRSLIIFTTPLDLVPEP